MKQTKADYIGHANACWDGCTFDSRTGREAEWGSRDASYHHSFSDVDGYGTREAAEHSVKLTVEYGLPPYEVVRRINGVWCNVW